jgi:ATP-binding cassette, subfamily B, bacterial
MAVSVRSAIPGRVRWDVPGLPDRPDLAAAITQTLSAYPGVQSVNANPVTGRVLLHHDPGLPLPFFQGVLEYVLRHGVAVPPPPPGGQAPASPSPGQAPSPGPQAAPRAPAPGQSLVITGRIHGTENPRSSQPPLIRLLTRTPAHQRLTARALTVSVLDHLFGSAAPALIGLGVDIVTRGPESLLGRVGIKTVPAQLIALGGLGAVVWTVDSLLGYARSVITSDLANLVQADLRNEVFSTLRTSTSPASSRSR